MNREIKFRGLNSKGEWEHGYLTREQFTKYDQEHYLECLKDSFLEWEVAKSFSTNVDIPYGYKIHTGNGITSVWVRKDSICQYIGHEDKAGKKLYQHDIIRFKQFHDSEKIIHNEYSIGEVVWDNEEACYLPRATRQMN